MILGKEWKGRHKLRLELILTPSEVLMLRELRSQLLEKTSVVSPEQFARWQQKHGQRITS